MEKKIATSLEVLIKVANYESIRMTKYAETKIEYTSEEERIKLEDALQEEVASDMVRSIQSLPDKFSKSPADAMDSFAERTKKIIPEWLESGAEPNIADNAKKAHEKADAEIHAEKNEKIETTKSTITEMEELFGPDPEPEDKKEEPKVEKDEPEEREPEELDVEDDEDLFA